jgi:hypothetical protein
MCLHFAGISSNFLCMEISCTVKVKPNTESAGARTSPAVDKRGEIDQFATNRILKHRKLLFLPALGMDLGFMSVG